MTSADQITEAIKREFDRLNKRIAELEHTLNGLTAENIDITRQMNHASHAVQQADIARESLLRQVDLMGEAARLARVEPVRDLDNKDASWERIGPTSATTVLRLAVPTGWLYQVSNWPPVFVPVFVPPLGEPVKAQR